jgi:hypothetical protein
MHLYNNKVTVENSVTQLAARQLQQLDYKRGGVVFSMWSVPMSYF